MQITFDMNELDHYVGVDFGDGQGEVPARQHTRGGGWVAETACVEESCYVGPHAVVFGKARVTGNAIVNDYARVYGEARVYDEAKVYGEAQVFDNVHVFNQAKVSGKAKVYEDARIMNNAMVYDNSEVYGKAIVRNNAEILNSARIHKVADIYDSIKVYDNCVATKKPKACFGFDYNVIITDHHVSLGCVSLPPKFIETTAKRVCRLMRYSPEQAEDWVKALRFIADFHGCTDRQEDIDNFDERKLMMDLLTAKVGIR
jgi:UDP-3-O-[3-hydroxymyristoyl] glucosamine N-acyltransferase